LSSFTKNLTFKNIVLGLFSLFILWILRYILPLYLKFDIIVLEDITFSVDLPQFWMSGPLALVSRLGLKGLLDDLFPTALMMDNPGQGQSQELGQGQSEGQNQGKGLTTEPGGRTVLLPISSSKFEGEGFKWTITGKYIIEDPKRQLLKGYDSTESNQPLASHLGNFIIHQLEERQRRGVVSPWPIDHLISTEEKTFLMKVVKNAEFSSGTSWSYEEMADVLRKAK
jgi:hypothetical protein